MAFKRINQVTFMADYISDLEALPSAPMGAECYVIENATEYKCNSLGKWIAQKSTYENSDSNSGECDCDCAPIWEKIGE